MVEVAANFKEQGNEYFKGKRHLEARNFYSQGIEAKPTDNALLESLLCNRAASNLELQNYGLVLKDCSRAITLNPKSSKAFYRSASALVALDRPEEAVDACARCLAFDPNNAGVNILKHRAEAATAANQKKKADREARRRNEESLANKLKKAFRERGLIPLSNSSDASGVDYKPHFASAGNPDVPEGTLIIPTFFLYPQHAQSDLVSEFAETMNVGEQLAIMFPTDAPRLAWDVNGEYSYDMLVVYAITHRKRLLKIGKKMTLREVMNSAKQSLQMQDRDGLEVRDGCISLVALPRGGPEQTWVEEFKSSRDRGQ